jgi:hypothetical protein
MHRSSRADMCVAPCRSMRSCNPGSRCLDRVPAMRCHLSRPGRGRPRLGGTAVERIIGRDAWLRAHGFRVLRSWNNEVMENLTGVLGSIAAELSGVRVTGNAPHPRCARPLPGRERRRSRCLDRVPAMRRHLSRPGRGRPRQRPGEGRVWVALQSKGSLAVTRGCGRTGSMSCDSGTTR